MNYDVNIWKDGDVITAKKLNHMEKGIADASVNGGTSTDTASSRIAFAVPSAGLEIEGGTVLGIGSCSDEHIVIPEFSPDGEKITDVADYAFGERLGDDAKQIKSITFPPSIERLGIWVVNTRYCSNLEAVYIMNPFIKWRSKDDEITGESAQNGMRLGPNVRNVFFGGSRERWVELNATAECSLISITEEALAAGMAPTVHYAHFITPPELKKTSEALAAHIVDDNNPHKVTAEQIGSYTREEVDGKLVPASYFCGEMEFTEDNVTIVSGDEDANWHGNTFSTNDRDVVYRIAVSGCVVFNGMLDGSISSCYIKIDGETEVPISNDYKFSYSGNVEEYVEIKVCYAAIVFESFTVETSKDGFMTGEDKAKLDNLEKTVGDFDTALDELHAYAQALVSGGASE